MKRARTDHIRDLIERLARINAADEWTDDLNPTQWAALSYLARANRFSRSPSQVTEYMSATRGTVSQTLKALSRKGLIEEVRSTVDRRWISYTVTKRGFAALDRTTVIEQALDHLAEPDQESLAAGLQTLLQGALEARGKRPFGQCRSCRHHKPEPGGGYCMLLHEALKPEETMQICHEHQAAA
ncbi:MAG: MarR family transcriptional regulator [Alphaproteobacteria bacterium]|nr:MarR family transcriptional regulator [Alphaproteobacteria bacterium]